jgi:hypothetical protein
MNRSDDRGETPRQPQQPSPSSAQQQRGADDQQYGEGNYKAARDYDRGVKAHLETHDVGREARDAAPRSEEEAREMERAEELGKRKAEGMKDPKDRMDDSAGGKDRGSVK